MPEAPTGEHFTDESESKVASPPPPPPQISVLKMSTSGLISVFKKFPKELFRVNNGLSVKLRPWTPKRRIYDLVLENGIVQPKALKPSSYTGQLL